MIYMNQFNEEVPPNIGEMLANEKPALSLSGATQVYVKRAKRPATVPPVQDAAADIKPYLTYGQAVALIVERLEEPINEAKFRALCAALQASNEAAIEWGLGWLSSCGLLEG